MMTAEETREILHKNIQMHTELGAQKAFHALDMIEACILNAAKECNTRTEVHILRLTTFDHEDEKMAYVLTIKEELKKNGYNVTFSPSSEVLHIIWGY